MEDKVVKNMVATEFAYNYIKDKRTVGIIGARFQSAILWKWLNRSE